MSAASLALRNIGRTYVYFSSAVSMTPRATRVCSWTAFSRGVGASDSRKALTLAASAAQMGRMVAWPWPLMMGSWSSVSDGISTIAIVSFHVSCTQNQIYESLLWSVSVKEAPRSASCSSTFAGRGEVGFIGKVGRALERALY